MQRWGSRISDLKIPAAIRSRAGGLARGWMAKCVTEACGHKRNSCVNIKVTATVLILLLG